MWRQWRRSAVFIFNFEMISQICSNVAVVDSEELNTGWECIVDSVY